MTTGSIAIEMQDGTITQVKVHSDGGLNDWGDTLFNNFTDPTIVAELVSKGSIYMRGETLDEVEFQVDAYEDDPDMEDLIWEECYQWNSFDEYIAQKDLNWGASYIFRKDNTWYYIADADLNVVTLESALNGGTQSGETLITDIRDGRLRTITENEYLDERIQEYKEWIESAQQEIEFLQEEIKRMESKRHNNA
jgi:hypothetical protein